MSENNSRMFRGPRNVETRISTEPCQLGVSDCMYYSNGGCSAEWCIYAELPKMNRTSKKLTCYICNENTTTVSTYSGLTAWICPECREKIKKVTPDTKPCAICNSNEVPVDKYVCDECREKINKMPTSSSCDICGTSVELGKSICNTCANKIRSKINE